MIYFISGQQVNVPLDCIVEATISDITQYHLQYSGQNTLNFI